MAFKTGSKAFRLSAWREYWRFPPSRGTIFISRLQRWSYEDKIECLQTLLVLRVASHGSVCVGGVFTWSSNRNHRLALRRLSEFMFILKEGLENSEPFLRLAPVVCTSP